MVAGKRHGRRLVLPVRDAPRYRLPGPCHFLLSWIACSVTAWFFPFACARALHFSILCGLSGPLLDPLALPSAGAAVVSADQSRAKRSEALDGFRGDHVPARRCRLRRGLRACRFRVLALPVPALASWRGLWRRPGEFLGVLWRLQMPLNILPLMQDADDFQPVALVFEIDHMRLAWIFQKARCDFDRASLFLS